MTAYTTANFTPDILPKGFKREAVAAVVYAIHMGWTVTMRRQIAHMSSPVGDKHIALGPRSRNENYDQIYRTIDKYASPLIPAPPKEDAPMPEVEEWAKKSAKVAIDNQRRAEAERKQKTTEKATLVKEGPMISKGGTLGGYTSNIANQREWSDGTIDYVCTRCGQEGKSPRGMASHWGKHVREDERARGGHKGVEVPVEKPAYQPTEERLSSLADAIAAALKEGIDWNDPEEAARQLAMAALTWDHDRRSDSEPGMREPLSDTDILNRIRSLVDNGLYESQEFAIVDLRAQAEEAERRAIAAEAQVETMRANLTAFMGMMVEEFKVEA